MRQPTLFEPPYEQAIMDMISQFHIQLASARSDTERRELKAAIRDWTAALEPIRKQRKPRHKK
ncbi:MAG TPA: hypothetical protein PKD45_15265 [Flavobacteriales bacterium]|nr:hypothetical protein [Flavobacteriales bacterium]